MFRPINFIVGLVPNWMQLDKETTDTYLNEEYIIHLVYLVQNGHTELEELTKQEQEEVENAIRRQ